MASARKCILHFLKSCRDGQNVFESFQVELCCMHCMSTVEVSHPKKASAATVYTPTRFRKSP